jgi:N-acetylglucosamine-6-phosphate deacetylase
MNLDLEYLVKITSANPAKLLQLYKGQLKEGYDADIVILDKDFNLKETIVMGKVIE